MSSSLLGDYSHHETSHHKHSQEKLEDGGRWYFSRKEIEDHSPSRLDNIDLKKETYLRKSYCTFLQDLGMRLKVPQLTIATAIIFCHRFFLRQSHAKNDRRTIATVCMFLAGKVEETPRPLKDVILVSYEIIHKKDPEAVLRIKQKEVYEQQKELILIGERVVLATLGFDLNVQHPYKPLVDAIKKFKVAQNALAQVAWNFVNDGLRTSLCLQFKPHHIAAGAIFLAAKFLKVKLPSDGEKVWWQEFDVTPRQLEEVSNQMLELYEQNRVPSSANNDGEGSTVGGATNQATSIASSSKDDHAVSNSHSHAGGATSRPGTSKPTSHPDNRSGALRTTQAQGNDSAGGEVKNDCEFKDKMGPEIDMVGHHENVGEAETSSRNSGKDQERNASEGGKPKHFGQKLENREIPLGQSPQDAIKKIDKDKVKAALEKRRRSRPDVARKTDILDEDDLIEQELEAGVELAVESDKNKKDKSHNRCKSPDRLVQVDFDDADGERQKSNFNNIEEGEVPEDMDHGFGSPKSNSTSHKRKSRSPSEKISEGRRNDPHHYNNHEYRLGYVEREHKRHVPENHMSTNG